MTQPFDISVNTESTVPPPLPSLSVQPVGMLHSQFMNVNY